MQINNFFAVLADKGTVIKKLNEIVQKINVCFVDFWLNFRLDSLIRVSCLLAVTIFSLNGDIPGFNMSVYCTQNLENLMYIFIYI